MHGTSSVRLAAEYSNTRLWLPWLPVEEVPCHRPLSPVDLFLSECGVAVSEGGKNKEGDQYDDTYITTRQRRGLEGREEMRGRGERRGRKTEGREGECCTTITPGPCSPLHESVAMLAHCSQ